MEDSRAVSLRLLRFVGTEGKERWGNKWRTDPACLRVYSPFPRSVRAGVGCLAWGGGVDESLCKGHSRSGACLPVCQGRSQPVLSSDLGEESKYEDFEMVFACFLLCFPLQGEAAAMVPLNLGWEEPGRSWRGDGLCEMRSLKPC